MPSFDSWYLNYNRNVPLGYSQNHIMRNLFLFTILTTLFACEEALDEQKIIDRAIATHGGALFEKSHVKFDFRSRLYSKYHDGHDIIYTQDFHDDSLGHVKDTLINTLDLTRYVNDTLVVLSDEWSTKYANSINSVLYFFQLPYGLNDPAVQKSLLPKNIVNDKMYYKIKVTFSQEGGGEDFEDVFVYWVNEKEFTVDYLAYGYHTNGGGLRFRAATNRRNVNGLVVQDYINYKPADETVAVYDLDELFETGQLIKLSVIESKNVSVTSL